MIPENMPELQAAFDDWVNKGSYELPTVQRVLESGQVPTELLHHLAKFIWMRAGGYVSSEAYSEMMKEWGAEMRSTPESALAFLERCGAITKVDE
jgi:hypothetical protein